jgi:hypothetical protein
MIRFWLSLMWIRVDKGHLLFSCLQPEGKAIHDQALWDAIKRVIRGAK